MDLPIPRIGYQLKTFDPAALVHVQGQHIYPPVRGEVGMGSEVFQGHVLYLLQLARGYRLLGGPQGMAGPRLDLGKDHDLSVKGDEVYFSLPGAEVALEDLIAPLFQVSPGRLLPQVPQLLLLQMTLSGAKERR